MSRPILFAEERKEEIVRLLGERSKLLIPELCAHFDVSPATIRNDLRDLEQAGRLRRTHGGAIPLVKAAFELPSSRKEDEHIEEKRRIAAFAASLIEDGDTILLDTGTTTLELAKLLSAKNGLTIVTGDIKIALLLEELTNASVFLLGGMLRRNFHSTTGASAIAQIADVNVDKAFMAANALSIDRGFTTPSIDLANVKKAMISTASTVVFLVDSHKLGRVSFAHFADLEDADKLVLDSGVEPQFMEQLQDKYGDLDVCVV